jgi:hypothetical protein
MSATSRGATEVMRRFGLLLAVLFVIPSVSSAQVSWNLGELPYSAHPNVRGVGNGSDLGERVNAAVAARSVYRAEMNSVWVPPNGTIVSITYEDGSTEKFTNVSASHNGIVAIADTFRPPSGTGGGSGGVDFSLGPGWGLGPDEMCITDANGWACTQINGVKNCTYIPAETICF